MSETFSFVENQHFLKKKKGLQKILKIYIETFKK